MSLDRIAVGLLLASSAFANIIPVTGGTASPDSLTASGTLLASTTGTVNALTGNTSDPGFTATVTEWVYSDPNNVFGAGNLDFIIQVTNNGPGINERVSTGGFAGFLTDIGIDTSDGIGLTGGVAPSTVDRSVNGNVVGFNFITPGSPIDAGQNSVLLEIQTNATSFVPGTVSVQDGTSGFTTGYAPANAPEPATLALAGGALLVLALGRRFKRATA